MGSTSPDTRAKEAGRELARQIILEDLEPLLRAQLAKAKGLKYLVTRDKATGKFVPVRKRDLKKFDQDRIEVWEKTPDTAAFRELMDRALDRAPMPIDVTAKLQDLTTMSTEDLLAEMGELFKLFGVKA